MFPVFLRYNNVNMSESTEEYYKKLPVVGGLIKWMEDNDMDYGPLVAGVSLSILLISLFVFGVSGGQVLSIFIALLPVWLPIILFIIFFNKWMDMVGAKYYLNQGRTTLRIKLPQEIFKSPEAMEFVISQIHNTANPDNLMQTYLDGKRPLPTSFEIVSIGGEVRFYINCPTKKTKNAVEANLYAQYPGIEIIEEPVDYTAQIPLDFAKHGYNVFSVHMRKKKDQEFPIKTYVDFGLDKMPKEEEKVDPMTPMLEVMANIAPHECLFVQFICLSYRPPSFKNGQLRIGEGPSWTKGVEVKINEIMQRDPETKGPLTKGDESDFEGMPRLTPGERANSEAMERNADKYAYKVGIRWIYLNKQGGFNGDLMNPMIRVFSQYDLVTRNSLGVAWRTDFDYKDIIPGGKKHELAKLKRQEVKEYRLRKYFPKGSADDYKIFTAEELATMFHLPGKVALTPTLERIPSTRAEAPPNLPTGEFTQ